MDNFFYDLNKRMANLSQQQTLTEGTVAERATGDYSATKARAGKDIGKPGKNFSKIAADAGQRYGSKAAGERVAGAVLNKLRHPKEGAGDTGPLTKATGGRANMPTSNVRSKYYPPAKPPVKKFAQPTTAFDRSKTGGLSQSYAQDQASRPAGMNPDPASRYAMGEADLDEVSRGEYIQQQDTNAEKSGKQKFNAFGQTFDTDKINEKMMSAKR